MRALFPLTVAGRNYQVVADYVAGSPDAVAIALSSEGKEAARIRVSASQTLLQKKKGKLEPAELIGLACAELAQRGLAERALAAQGELAAELD